MRFDKIKNFFIKIVSWIVTGAKKLYFWARKWLDKFFDRFPIQDKYKRILSMSTLSLILVALILVSIPVAKNIGTTVGDAVENIAGTNNTGNPQKVEPMISAPEIRDVLPDTLVTPENDMVTIPTGGAAWKFSESEIYRLQRMMVYLERCDSFDYNGDNKNANMALASFRYLIDTGNFDLISNEAGTQYYTEELNIKKGIVGLFGKALSAKQNLGAVTYMGGSYIYDEPNPGPATATGYVTEAYSLGKNYYKISGVVTRGFQNEEGRYSRRLSVILLKDSTAMYGYYVISLINESMGYTYIDTLPDFYKDPGNQELGEPQIGTPGTTSYTTVGGDDVSSNPEDTSSGSGEVTSGESVVLPEITDTLNKTKLSSADEKSVKELFAAIPNLILDFDVSKESSQEKLKLLSHLMLCKEQNVDYKTNATTNPLGDLNHKSKTVFGTALTGVTTENESKLYTLDPYIVSGKTELKIKEVYDLGNNQYLLVCNVSYSSNPLLNEADANYTYKAVVEKSESALYKFFLKSQTYVKQ